MAEVGPDGNVWVIDWYNYIVQHNPTPAGFETGKGARLRDRPARQEARPHLPRRLRRTGARGQGQASRLSLASATPAEAGRRRSSTTTCSGGGTRSGCWSSAASRTSCRRSSSWSSDQSVDEIGLNVGAIHALWTLHGLGRWTAEREAAAGADAALKHPSAGVRRNAVQVLPQRPAVAGGDPRSRRCSTDPDPQVRLAALLALADQPPDDARPRGRCGVRWPIRRIARRSLAARRRHRARRQQRAEPFLQPSRVAGQGAQPTSC